MEITLVHWSTHKPEAEVAHYTFDRQLPFTMHIQMEKDLCIEMHCMNTESEYPHLIKDELFETEDNLFTAAIIGMPFAWDDFGVLTWIETKEGMLIAVHHDPIPPPVLLAEFEAGNEDTQQLFLKLDVATI